MSSKTEDTTKETLLDIDKKRKPKKRRKRREQSSSSANMLFFFFMTSFYLTSILQNTVTILGWEAEKDIGDLIEDLPLPVIKCPENLDSGEYFVVGMDGVNATYLIDTKTSRKIAIRHNDTHVYGKNVQIPENKELWNLDRNNAVVSIYENLSLRKRAQIDLPSTCVMPSAFDYSGPIIEFQRGYVWILCSGNSVIQPKLLVYDVASRNLTREFEISAKTLDNYVPDDVRVSKKNAYISFFAKTELQPGGIQQIHLENGTLGWRETCSNPYIHHNKRVDGHLYVVCKQSSSLFQINTETGELIQESYIFSAPIYVTTDPLDRYVYVVNSMGPDSFELIQAVFAKNITQEIPNSPFTTSYENATAIYIDSKSSHALVLHDGTDIASGYHVNSGNGNIETMYDDFFLDRNAETTLSSSLHIAHLEKNCVCDFCGFYTNDDIPQQTILESEWAIQFN